MNFIITGGGTGGHLSIVDSFKKELNKREIKPIYIGSTKGMDREWFENDEGFCERYFFDSFGVVNQKGFKKIGSILNILKISKECIKIIKSKKIDAIISVGGYSAAPASFAAILTNTPLFIHEQNAIKGRLNKILSPFAKRVFCSFLPPFDPYPVDDLFFEKRRVRESIKTIIFLGGSQGAKEINDFAIEVAKDLSNKGIKIIHQTGKRDFKRVLQEYKKLKIDAEVFDFDKNIVDRIQKADLAISRAGASTLWELSANALVSFFIPYPYAANNHQYYNAKYLVDRECGFLVKKDKKEELFDILEKDIKPFSENLIKISKKDGVKNLVDKIIATLNP